MPILVPVVSFRRSVIISELWRPEVARVEKVSTFGVFLEKRPLRGNVQNSVPKRFTASPIHVLCANFVKFGGRKIGKVVRYSPDKNSPGTPAVATVRIAPKVCQNQSPTMYSECSRFHPNRFTLGGVIAERVNTVEMRHAMKCFQYSAEA